MGPGCSQSGASLRHLPCEDADMSWKLISVPASPLNE